MTSQAKPIMGYPAIARATAAALGSCSVVTAKRWAKAPTARRPRLPVFCFPNGRAYMQPAHLELFVAAWRAAMPAGARLPRGARP